MQKSILVLLLGLMVISCQSIPEKAKAVSDFELEQYLGKWYEIARLDFKFEKDLDNTTAFYSLNENGTVKVLNKGFNTIKQSWQEAEGKAKFRGKDDIGELEVSFFGPFYSGYNVVAITPDYEFALVFGSSLKYMWILSRTPKLKESVKTEFLKLASAVGYDTSQLVWVNHNQ